MVTHHKLYTSEEFWDFVNLPENRNKEFERWNGDFIEVPFSVPYFSMLATQLTGKIVNYLDTNSIAWITGEAGGYDISAMDTFAPDIGVILKASQPILPRKGFNPIPPDLAVEVISFQTSASQIHEKILKYLQGGTHIVWEIYSEPPSVVVHTPAGARTLTIKDTLDAGSVLPNFALPVQEIFPQP